MQLADFDFELPEELIAKYPPTQRSGGRLLEVGAQRCFDRLITDLPSLLRADDLIVLNDTQVIPARLFGEKSSGGKVELLVERLSDATRAWVHLRSSKSPKIGGRLRFAGCEAEVLGRDGALFDLRFDQPLMPLLAAIGHMPLPPYIDRDDEKIDLSRYQTVFAENPGAVAAPTAGLHFDQAMLASIAELGCEVAKLTLHVGAGTFQPVKTERIEDHIMHKEAVKVSPAVAAQIALAKSQQRRIIAVGTTVLRSLETLALQEDWQHKGFEASSQLFVKPGFEFALVDAMLTNFHLPKSTLLMLVSAFSGSARIRAAYQHAIYQQYRFYSYGDAMFLQRMADSEERL